MAIQLVSIDRRKGLAVYEQDGVKRVIKVRFDKDGNPILDAETQMRLDQLFEDEKGPTIPNTPFARRLPITIVPLVPRGGRR